MPLFRTLFATTALALGAAAPAHAIVGGNDATPGEYPYVVYVSIDKSSQCTGTLVDPTHVITASHCASLVPGGIVNVPVGQPGQLIEVAIGAHKQPTPTLTGLQTDGEYRKVSKVDVNPNYVGVNSVKGDATVLTLATPSTKTPVKIANAAERSSWAPGTSATIAGFGRLESGGDLPDVLQEARVPIRTDQDAADAYPYLVGGVDPFFGGFESATQLAAGNGGTDTCQGDSGGPLLVDTANGKRLVGDTSYGAGCADPEYPGIYGRIADTTLREWIRSVAPNAIAG